MPRWIVCAFILCTITAITQAAEPAKPVIPNPASPVDLHHVRLLDGPFKVSQDVHAKYLLSLDVDRLLARYRTEAGLPSAVESYPGWETKELPGVGAGFYLMGCSRLYAVTGDQRFLDRVVTLLDGLQAAQKAQGDGFLLATHHARQFVNEIERGDIRLDGGWLVNGEPEPYYALEKLFSGLRDAYRIAGQRKALDIAVDLADWLDRHTARLSDDQLQHVMSIEYGGINWVLADLYADTGEPRYLALSKRWHERAIMEPLSRGQDILPGHHANTQFPKFSGLAARYPYSADPFDRITAEFFWDRVAHHHSYVTGDNSLAEHFGPADHLDARLAENTTETCNAWNMLRLTSLLFAIEPRADLADFAERVLWNHVLPAQNPDDGRVCYFLPLASGSEHPYEPLYDRFACCTCSSFDSYARHADSIYYETADTLFVNQFIASELQWKPGLKVGLESRIPDEARARIRVSCDAPQRFKLAVRSPRWATDGLEVKVGGQPLPVSARPSGYLVLDREWRDGDVVDLTFSMPLRIETMPDNPRRIAFFKGPALLAGELGSEPAPALVTSEPPGPALIQAVDAATSIYRLANVGRPRDVDLKPFYRVRNTHYAVYWDVLTPDEWSQREADRAREEARRKAVDARTIDRVLIGETDSESAHNLQNERSNTGRGAYGLHPETHWRDASGWFSYDLKAVPGAGGEILCQFWGGETGARTFDVLINGQKAATLTLDSNHPKGFYEVAVAIPPSAGEKITVRFQAHEGNTAGGLFGLRSLKPGP